MEFTDSCCICINYDAVKLMAGVVKKFTNIINENKIDIYDERYFPSKKHDLETTLRYLLVVVALDHRLSRPGKPYEACLDDGCYHGADLLYRITRLILDEKPDFFNPEYLRNLTMEVFTKYYNVDNAVVPDPDTRVYLLRDIGDKLLSLFNGRVEVLVDKSSNRLKNTVGKPGLIELLKVFRAYEDPVEKKAYLLAKFLEARGVLKIRDSYNKEVPVDNHLTRIALRTGIVEVKGLLFKKIKEGREASWTEDIMIRLTVREAFKKVALESGIDLFVFDDFLWLLGRKTCYRDKEPLCSKCVFKNICRAYSDSEYMVSEHMYYNTWYY